MPRFAALAILFVLVFSGCGGTHNGPPQSAITPGETIYVANSESANVSAFQFAVSPTGSSLVSLAPASGSPFPVSTPPTALGGNFNLIVASSAEKTISAYKTDPMTGALSSFVATISSAYTPEAIGIWLNFVYVADAEGYVSVYELAGNSLSEISGSPFAAGASPAALTVAPELGPFVPYPVLYIANSKSNNISAYSIDSTTGAIAALPGSPYAAGTAPDSIVAVAPFQNPTTMTSPAIVVATNRGSNNVSVYLVGSGGSLAPVLGSPFPAGLGPAAATTVLNQPLPSTSNTGGQDFLYVANSGSNDISAYNVDPATGVLTPLTGSPFKAGTRPSSIAASNSPAPEAVFVANAGSNDMSVYGINQVSGALQPIYGSPFSVGNSPQHLLFIYVSLVTPGA